MKALKGFVIFMGLLIVGGLTLVGYGLMTRVASDKETDGQGSVKVAGDAFGEITVTLPSGCVIAEARSEGDRLILRGDGPAERGCQQVLVLDLASGKVLGRVKVTPGL